MTLYDETGNETVFSDGPSTTPLTETGPLSPGHTYRYQYSTTYYDDDGNPSSGSASTTLTLIPLPEPASLLVALTALPLLTLRRLRKQRPGTN